MDAIAQYMAQFGSDSDSDDDDFNPEAEKPEKEEDKKVEEKKEKVEIKEEKKPEPVPKVEVKPEAKPEEREKTIDEIKAENPELMKIILDNDQFIPVKKLTPEEKMQSNKQVTNYFANILGNFDDEEEDDDDAEYTTLTTQEQKPKKAAESEKKETNQQESDTEPIKAEEILEPLEKLLSLIGSSENASDALVNNDGNEEVLSGITNNATKLLFLGFGDIYQQSSESLKKVYDDLKAKIMQ